MLILVEGCDKSGKTSLIKELQNIYGCSVLKNLLKPTDYSKDFMAGLYAGTYQSLLACNDMEELIILDRSHITEVVYSEVVRNDKNLTLPWDKVDHSLAEEAIVIYMKASMQTLRTRHLEEKEEYLPPSKIQSILSYYDSYLEQSSLKSLTLSSDNDMSSNLTHAIKFITKKWTYLKSKNRTYKETS